MTVEGVAITRHVARKLCPNHNPMRAGPGHLLWLGFQRTEAPLEYEY